jgi:hypothetical protein
MFFHPSSEASYGITSISIQLTSTSICSTPRMCPVPSRARVAVQRSAMTRTLAIVLAAASTVVARAATSIHSQTDIMTESVLVPNPPELECGLWLAPSTIPGAGLGMYAGRDFNASESMHRNHNHEPVGDLCVPLVDLDDHYGSTLDLLLGEYVWKYVLNLCFLYN